MSAAALIASGYLITWARLANVEAPSRAVLSALSTSYYLGVALESLLLLLFVVVAVGAVFLVLQSFERSRRALDVWPSRGSWLFLGSVIALIGLLAAGWPLSILFASHTHPAYLPATIAVGLSVVGLAWAAASAGKALHLNGLGATAAAVLLLSTVAAVGFKILDARLGPIPFPEAAAWVPKADCTTPESEYGSVGCGFVGFYVGEDGHWIYLVRTPLNCEGQPHFPPRLVLVPRDKPLDLAVSEKLRASAPACPQGGQAKDEGGKSQDGVGPQSQRTPAKKGQQSQAGGDAGKANSKGQKHGGRNSAANGSHEHKGAYRGSEDQTGPNTVAIGGAAAPPEIGIDQLWNQRRLDRPPSASPRA